jgi:dTMP kinase
MIKKMEIIRNFVVFEGIDGSGTSTQLDLLGKRFSGAVLPGPLPVFFPTFEPTPGPIGSLIRSALKGEAKFTGETLARLFAADRSEHLYAPEGVIERARRGELVVCDRYVPSSLVYQGLECGGELPQSLNASFPGPEILLYFDLDPNIASERLKGRSKLEIFEYLDFQIKVRDRYRELLPAFSARGIQVETIDASLSPENVAAGVWSVLRKMPIFERGI